MPMRATEYGGFSDILGRDNTCDANRVTRHAPLPSVSPGLMLRPSSATRLLIRHTPPPSSLRTLNAFATLRRHTPPTPYRAQRSVATLVTETAGSQHSILLHAPVLNDIEDSEYDADLIPPEEAKLGITERAAEVRSDYLQSPVRHSSLPSLLPFRSSTLIVILFLPHTATADDLATSEQSRGCPESCN